MATPPSERGWLVVGLGNPGPQYAANRHNAGAMVVQALAEDLRVKLSAHKTRAHAAEVRLPPIDGQPGPRLVLAVPDTYMNVSGGPVAGLARFYHVEPDRLLVLHDELDLPFGTVRLKFGGGEGGHNGLRSISQSINTKEYRRVRLGIGRPPGRMDPADYVLRDFPSREREEAGVMVNEAAEVVLDVVRSGWERTQNDVNARRP